MRQGGGPRPAFRRHRPGVERPIAFPDHALRCAHGVGRERPLAHQALPPRWRRTPAASLSFPTIWNAWVYSYIPTHSKILLTDVLDTDLDI